MQTFNGKLKVVITATVNRSQHLQLSLLKCIAKLRSLCFVPVREYKTFPGLRRDIFKDLCLGPLAKWLRQKKQQWHRQNRHMYKFL